MTDKLRFGVISTAQIARNYHVPAARNASNAEIIAISSRDYTRADYWAQELGISKAYGTYAEMLDDPSIDAVINALPNSMHYEWTIKAVEAGKHVLCEKPLAVTVAECRHMIDAAKANGVLLMEAFTHHFNPAMRYILETIRNGFIGELRIVRSELTYTIRDWAADARVKPELDGGSLYDCGCYAVNTVRSVMGDEPVSVQGTQKTRQGVDAAFVGVLQFPGGRLATITSSMESPFRFTCEVIGSKGWLATQNLFKGDKVVVSADGEQTVKTFDPIDRFQAQLEHFSDCVLTGKPLHVQPEDGLLNAAVLAALKASAQSNVLVEDV